MKVLIWLGGFITGATTMLAVVLWVLSGWEVIQRSELVDMTAETPNGRYDLRGWLVEKPNG